MIEGFEPSQYLTVISGAEYLEVKWRLAWFRDRYPHGHIDTEIHTLNSQVCVVRATVTAIDEDGKTCGIAAGIGSETPGDFRDYIEKAETKAIGRALGALGFGTQFSRDFEMGGAVVDSPVGGNGSSRPPSNQQTRPQPSNGTRPQGNDRPAAQPGNAPTERQIAFLNGIASEKGLDHDDLAQIAQEHFNTTISGLDRRQASQLIDRVQQLATVAAEEPEQFQEGGW